MIGSVGKALWQVLKMYDAGGKLLTGIKSTYVNSQAGVRVKGDESEWFRIDSGVRQGYIKFLWLFNLYMDSVMEVNMLMGKRGVRFLEEGLEWRLLRLLYVDDLVLCSESEEDLRTVLLKCVEGED